MEGTRLVHAADEAGSTQRLGSGQPICKGCFPPWIGGARTVHANQLPVVGDGAVHRGPYLQNLYLAHRRTWNVIRTEISQHIRVLDS